MCGQYQYFGYLHVLWCIGSIDSHIGNIVARQRGDAFVQFGSTLFVTFEADVAKVRLYQSRLQVRYTDGGISYVDAQTIR